MAESVTLLALFEEIGPAADGVEKLQSMGLDDDQMNVISGVPVPGRFVGRPGAITHVSKIALTGAILGFFTGIALVWGTPFLFPLRVGNQPIYPIPMGWIVLFEMTMLGLMVFAFVGMFVDSGFPSYTPKEYVPEISNGMIALFFVCERNDQAKYVDALTKLGAESVRPAEANQL